MPIPFYIIQILAHRADPPAARNLPIPSPCVSKNAMDAIAIKDIVAWVLLALPVMVASSATIIKDSKH